jgi:hypothetical protein
LTTTILPPAADTRWQAKPVQCYAAYVHQLRAARATAPARRRGNHAPVVHRGSIVDAQTQYAHTTSTLLTRTTKLKYATNYESDYINHYYHHASPIGPLTQSEMQESQAAMKERGDKDPE